MLIEEEMASIAEEVGRLIASSLNKDGPLYESAYHLPLHGGKRMRPYLVVKACEALGGNRSSALAPAAAVELLHNFTLVHDDIMDNDLMRRGVPTVHTLWGTPTAILAGDLLFAEAFGMILGCGLSDERARGAASILAEATIKLSVGQFQDMSFEDRSEITEAEYLEMISGKTAALFEACAKIGAVAGGGSEEEVRLLGSYGWNLGMGFQIFDDYLGIVSDEEALGKSVGNDIREGKKTLIVIKGLQAPSRAMLQALLGNKNTTKPQLEMLVSSLGDCGVLEYVREKALAYAKCAKEAISPLPDSAAKSSLLELAELAVKRSK